MDIQADAIDQFSQAIAECGVQDRVTPVCADLKQLWQDAPLERCDLVTCNPPYKAYQAGMESQLTAQKLHDTKFSATLQMSVRLPVGY